MKVCTDSCILGAWFAQKTAGKKRILDIGAGSGLLSLMLAQKSEAAIDAIEIDPSSFQQLNQNIADSPWKDNITAIKGDAATYTFPAQYDFIITNPPFYEGDLLSPEKQKNIAKHHTGLTLQQLTGVIENNLSPDGSFGILLPFHRTDVYKTIARKSGFFLHEQLFVRQTPGHDYFRTVLHFSKQETDGLQTYSYTIKDNHHAYTPEFTALLKDYYLHL